MDFAAYSNLAMMTAWLLYLVAMGVFGVEWAMARRVPDDTAQEASTPEREAVLVGAAASAAGSPPAYGPPAVSRPPSRPPRRRRRRRVIGGAVSRWH
ncbi:hypothetical protein [Raineyella fluvialis]|uniref:Uncharacterized protein n=1 Tax=Raineyella fluvialis TaxID=2662261 RepID=A0A5Q2FAY5_9ACTN|nr:hypothetical protein [Raineyella fluvialis]QGF23959.1 hypothetical protein Rai3103_10045 [Raineyella fluvialis]